MAAPRQPDRDRPPASEEPEWSREDFAWWEWVPSRRLLRAIRDYQRHPPDGYLRMLAVLRHRLWSAIAGADIPLNASLGGGLLMPHPNGIVIHPDATIGANCLLFQQVTIGTGTRPGFPVLAANVDVGAGAKILGGIRIGARAKIGANAVVLDDVPAGAVAVGVPAKILGSTVSTPVRSNQRAVRGK